MLQPQACLAPAMATDAVSLTCCHGWADFCSYAKSSDTCSSLMESYCKYHWHASPVALGGPHSDIGRAVLFTCSTATPLQDRQHVGPQANLCMPCLLRLRCSAPASEAPFHAGTAISVWQNSGAVWQSLDGGPSNWDTWVHKKTLFGGSPIMGGHKVAVAAIL